MKKVFLIVLTLILSNLGFSKMASKFSLISAADAAPDSSTKEGGNHTGR